jgi:glycosyltransferase involved in cell wall biosynthesis
MISNRWPRPEHHGGIFVKRQVDAIRELGHHVDVELIAQSRGTYDYLASARRVRAREAGGRYDIVHVHYGLSALAASLITSTSRVLSLYGSDVNTTWQRLISLHFSRGYAARIYVSRRLADRAGDSQGIVIPPGVDLQSLVPGDRRAARSAVGVGPDERVILFGASPARAVKGWGLFVGVVERLRAAGIPVKPLVLTEPGQTTERLVQKFDAADVLLFTSNRGSEGSPIVVREAMVMGLPVVSVDVGDVAEQLEGVEPSVVVPFPTGGLSARARDVLTTSLTRAVTAVLSEGRRSNGRQRAADMAPGRVAHRIISVYEAAIRRWV